MVTSTLEKALKLELLLLLLLLTPLIDSSNLKKVVTNSFLSSSFPPYFLFGTSSSALQYEGGYLADGKGLDIWDVYSHIPGKVDDGSNGDVADDQYHLYKEDADLLASLGVNSHKISIQWARVLPKGRYGNISWAGIEYYKNFINYLLQKGIEPFVTLNHYDMPQELEDKYEGWLSSELQEEYAYFAEVCFKYLGDGVKYWVTFNEPNMWTQLAYLRGVWPPSHCSGQHNCTKHVSLEAYFMVAHNIILAHASAVNIYRNKYQKEQGQIGIAVLYYWYEPLSNSTADKLAAERALSFHSNWFLDPIIYGAYPKEMKNILGSILPKFSSNELEKLKAAAGVDFIGLNHYTTNYVKDCLFSQCEPNEIGNSKEGGFLVETTIKNGESIGEVTGLDYLFVYPPGMERVIMYVKKRYPNLPIYVAENGYCDHTDSNSSITEILHDVDRVNFLNDYLGSIQTAIRKGADVRGYFVWSFLDNFEWAYGYTKHMGLYHVDRVTLKRIPKLSAKWYKNFIAERVMEAKTRTKASE